MNETNVETAFLTRAEAAKYLGLQPTTLYAWGARDVGPPFVKLNTHAKNGAIRYPRELLEAWAAAGMPLDRRGARPSNYPAGGYGGPRPGPIRRDARGKFQARNPST